MPMTFGRKLGGVWGLVLGVMIVSAAWGSSAYLQTRDWQYKELDALAQQGLLVGHPAAPISTWSDRLSRYEAAALTLRAVEGIGRIYQEQGTKLRALAQVNETGEAAPAVAPQEIAEAPDTTEVMPASPTVRTEDLVRVGKLVEEFRTELVAMGEKVDELGTSIKLVLGMVEDLQKQVDSVAGDQKRHKLDGYIQYRLSRDDANSGRQNFYMKGARVNVRGPLGPNTAYRVEMQFDGKEGSSGAPGSKAQLRTAQIDYKFNDLAMIRAGQMTLPWGYELEVSTPDLWTGDRSYFMDRLFPDQRDQGVFAEVRPSLHAPLLDFGLFNGVGINTLDTNEQLNWMARAKWNVPYGTAAISAYSGEAGTRPSRTEQDRYGVGTNLAFGPAQFMGEYVRGKDKGKDVDGWYAQLGYPVLSHRKNLLFAKYDTFNEDKDAANKLFKRWSLGYWYEFDKYMRLTFVWELRDVGRSFSDYTKYNGNAEFLQLEVRF